MDSDPLKKSPEAMELAREKAEKEARRNGERGLRPRLVEMVEESFQFWGFEGTRMPGTEMVDVPKLVDMIVGETIEYIYGGDNSEDSSDQSR